MCQNLFDLWFDFIILSLQEEDEEGGEGDQEASKDPTHYSELDPKNMKVS